MEFGWTPKIVEEQDSVELAYMLEALESIKKKQNEINNG